MHINACLLTFWLVVFLRCVNKDYGAIGCAVDVLSFADSRCSGRSRCTVTVADFSLRGIRPCPQDLTSYFEAAYYCVPGESSASDILVVKISVSSIPQTLRLGPFRKFLNMPLLTPLLAQSEFYWPRHPYDLYYRTAIYLKRCAKHLKLKLVNL